MMNSTSSAALSSEAMSAAIKSLTRLSERAHLKLVLDSDSALRVPRIHGELAPALEWLWFIGQTLLECLADESHFLQESADECFLAS